MVEGYKWRPDAKPHDGPDLGELRRCYRAGQVFFGRNEGGTSGGVGRSWERASQTFPAKTNSKMGQDLFNQVEFLVVHIVAIKGSTGYLYVDDVTLERTN
jgi:hypothetical protein